MFGKIKLTLIFFLGFWIIFNPTLVLARENVTDWYIKDFQSQIVVNLDSSLDITEKITADCGRAAGKHGIFRILPEEIHITDGSAIKTPVEIISITDFNDKPIKYTESKNYTDNTVTWKIGDADKTVTGVNYYKIHYRVENTIRFSQANFDELYWNLNGNFWELEIDNFEANIIFPAGVTQDNSTVEYYTGYLGGKGTDLARYSWSADNVLTFNSQKPLLVREGITASITFPKNIFIPYRPGFLEKYGLYLALIIPGIVFFVCFYFWWYYGKDPKVDKAIVPEYDAPGSLTPMDLGMLMRNGGFEDKFITAEIINLATKKLIAIKELDNKILFFHSRDYELSRSVNKETEKQLSRVQKEILNKIFEKGHVIKLSTLKNKFYKAVKNIQTEAENSLKEKGLIMASGLQLRTTFVLLGVALMISSFFLGNILVYLAIALFFSGLIILIFSFAMPKRTAAGAELNWEIKGFKMFMETVDKDRAEFYERENIFEKFLPYAIVFGITALWIQKMKEIYGEDFYAGHVPAWYIGANMATFNADSFSSAIDNLSSSIATNTSSPSGSGGSGGSGGGGGGGGGGGW